MVHPVEVLSWACVLGGSVFVIIGGIGTIEGPIIVVIIEEIVVVSQKREQTLQSLPVAVSVVSKQQLDEAQILDVKDLQFLVPSLRVSQLQTSANATFLIRGFGNGANNAGVEPSVGVFIVRKGENRPPEQLSSDKWDLGDEVLVEKFIPGRELTVAVMGDRPRFVPGAE